MKKVFITGGSSGIGLELSKLYLQKGWSVGICARDISKLPLSLRENARSYQLDVKDAEALKKAIKDFSMGRLDVIIANAGISIDRRLRIPDEKNSRDIVETNILGVLNTVFPAIEIMKEQGFGTIVGMGSVAGMVGLPGKPVYSMSKASVMAFFEALSIDLAPFGIQAITIAPGFIETALTKKNKHAMPFKMSAEAAAHKIVDAIEENKTLTIFPFPMKWLMLFLQKIPRSFYRFLMKKFYRY